MSRDRREENKVREFYEEFGWKEHSSGRGLGEDVLFREFPKAHVELYAPGRDERTRRLFDGLAGRLLIVGPGDLPDTHVQIARRFSQVTLMDISQRALEVSRRKLGSGADYVVGSIVDTTLDGDQFDAVLCAHVLYHIDALQQENAVRQMIRLTRPGGRVVVIYANPRSPMPRLIATLARALRLRKPVIHDEERTRGAGLYRHVHPHAWWRRFGDEAEVSVRFWQVFPGWTAQRLTSEAVARVVYRLTRWTERLSPTIATRLWAHSVIVLDKPAPG